MADPVLPRFTIKNHFQKSALLYRDLLTDEILGQICNEITGQPDFIATFDDDGYNIGRLAILDHGNGRAYVSISETAIKSRNSSFQSFASALSRYLLDPSPSKAIIYYVHPATSGNIGTDYFQFMYRLMRTAGVRFLDGDNRIKEPVIAFASVDDIILSKDRLRKKGKGNNSTYITRGPDGETEIYGKTYGANKYESTLLGVASATFPDAQVALYQVREGGLNALPALSVKALGSLGNVVIFTSDEAIETVDFETNDSLRSARFIYNLLERLGRKKCAFCDCEIPQIIQGAHVWPVATIKQQAALSLQEKLAHALDGGNGLWLCENHHKLLDSRTLFLSAGGLVKYRSILTEKDHGFVDRITTSKSLVAGMMQPDFLDYLNRRNADLQEYDYLEFLAQAA